MTTSQEFQYADFWSQAGQLLKDGDIDGFVAVMRERDRFSEQRMEPGMVGPYAGVDDREEALTIARGGHSNWNDSTASYGWKQDEDGILTFGGGGYNILHDGSTASQDHADSAIDLANRELYIQFGRGTATYDSGSGGYHYIDFDEAFPTTCMFFFPMANRSTGSTVGVVANYLTDLGLSDTRARFTLYTAGTGGGKVTSNQSIVYLAMGY